MIVEEFRRTGGQIDPALDFRLDEIVDAGEHAEAEGVVARIRLALGSGIPFLLLHHVGAHTGVQRMHPLGYRPEGNTFVLFATNGGAPRTPHWYYNLLVRPRTTIEVGSSTLTVVARVADREERDELWSRQRSDFPFFANYETRTTRTIPIVILEPADCLAGVPTKIVGRSNGHDRG
jgi:deazaflavin-dependent oxidoreductase (nitroreductase family)